MKLWITTLLLTFVVACAPGADLVGQWQSPRVVVGSNWRQTFVEFRVDGTFAMNSLSFDAVTGCTSENASVTTYETQGAMVRFQSPRTSRFRATGCTNPLNDVEWEETPVMSQSTPRFVPYRINGDTLTIGESTSVLTYTRDSR